MDDTQTNKARTSRSDEGILALVTAVHKYVFGLTDETTSRILKIIQNHGQWQDLKGSVRSLPGVAYRRLNDVINMIQGRGDPVPNDGFDSEHENEVDLNKHDFDVDHDKEMPMGERMTFVGFLLNELQYSDEDLRDPQKKQEIMRLMRSGDRQAPQLIQRAERDQKQDTRQEVQQETDPRKITLRRQKMRLEQQLALINKQLGDETESTGGL